MTRTRSAASSSSTPSRCCGGDPGGAEAVLVRQDPRMAALFFALADPAYRRPVRARLPVSLRAEPGQGAVALGHLGQRHRGGLVARRLDAVLLVRGELRQLR